MFARVRGMLVLYIKIEGELNLKIGKMGTLFTKCYSIIVKEKEGQKTYDW